MDNKKHIALIKKQIADLRFQLTDTPWIEFDPEDEEAIENEIGNLEIALNKLKKRKKKPMRETHMKDMKLKTLLPVGKIDSRQKLEEILDIHADKNGVSVAVDDYDDVLFRGRNAGLRPEELLPIIQALAKTRWFIKLVTAAAKRKVSVIEMGFTNDGISFR